MTLTYNGVEYKSGDKIFATISGELVFGKLYIENSTRCYVCHNVPNKSGTTSPDLLGFSYSWYFHKYSYKGEDGKDLLSDTVVLLGTDDSESGLRKFVVHDKLNDFLYNQKIPTAFLERDNIFKEYDEFSYSDTTGMIKMTGNSMKFGIIKGRKSIEIKFGRFLTAYQNDIKKIMDGKYDLKLGIQDIENKHNNYLSYQKGDYVKVEIVSGEKLLDAYKRENYAINKSSLAGSCMTDQLEFLKVYSQNPDTVQMLVVKMFDKVAGRALLFKTKCGKTIMERAYICDEWVNNKISEIFKEGKYERPFGASGDEKFEINLNIEGINAWPYLDSFYFMVKNKENTRARLMNYCPTGRSLVLRNTGGGTSSHRIDGDDVIVK